MRVNLHLKKTFSELTIVKVHNAHSDVLGTCFAIVFVLNLGASVYWTSGQHLRCLLSPLYQLYKMICGYHESLFLYYCE